jgi:hypothetical protein
MNYVRILFLAFALACVGAGCAKSPSGSAQKPSTNSSSSNPSAQNTPRDPRAELRAAMSRFKATKSFRTKVSIQTSQGEMDATLEFAKPNRFRGTIQPSGGNTTEIIVVDNSLYMRVNGQKWINLSSTPSAKTIGETLRNALQGDASLDTLGVDTTANIQVSRDNARECDDYKTTVKAPDGSLVDVDLCLSNGLPRFLDMTPKQGPIHLEYYDYNAVFLIEKPL